MNEDQLSESINKLLDEGSRWKARAEKAEAERDLLRTALEATEDALRIALQGDAPSGESE
jgi:hypothetical protein